jgi:hypothetical protein
LEPEQPPEPAQIGQNLGPEGFSHKGRDPTDELIPGLNVHAGLSIRGHGV